MNAVPEHIITTHLAHLESEAAEAREQSKPQKAARLEGGAEALRFVLGEYRDVGRVRRIDIAVIDGETVSLHTHKTTDGSDEPRYLRVQYPSGGDDPLPGGES